MSYHPDGHDGGHRRHRLHRGKGWRHHEEDSVRGRDIAERAL